MNTFFTSYIAHALTGGCLYCHSFYRKLTQASNVFTHGRLEWQDLRRLKNKRAVDIDDAIAMLVKQSHCMLDKLGAGSPLPPRVGIGEMLTNVSHCYGAEKCVNESVKDHVTVAVSNSADRRWDLHACKYQRLTFGHTVDIESKSYHVTNLRLCWIVDLCFMQEEAVSVSELTHAIKGLLEVGIGDVAVVGELSNYKLHSSGHRYFTLKDATSQIPCVMWRSRSIPFQPEDGMRVVVSGKLTVYAAQGKYQIDCVSMQREGVGDLYVAFEKLKRELAERGFFDQEHKRRLPVMPTRVGIATSSTGAALRDMLTTIERRFPAMHVMVRPTLVQGEGASSDIAKAIGELAAAGVDVIIVGRGGGSIEDLWSFNTREVAEAIFSCTTPVISAVGHETDVTIADFVADVRAATPTAAAELVTAVTLGDIMYTIDLATDRMTSSVRDHIEHLSEMAAAFTDGRAMRRIAERVSQRRQRIEDLCMRYMRSLMTTINIRRQEVESAMAICRTLHPHAPLERGYAVVEHNGKPLALNQPLQPGDIVQVRRKTETSTVLIQSTKPTTETETP